MTNIVAFSDSQAIGVAHRVHRRDARAAFHRGETIAVSEQGHLPAFNVYPTSTVHSTAATTWEWLLEQVDTWGNRYSNQRFYVINYNNKGV